MKIETAFITNKGLFRDNNEDSILISDELYTSADMEEVLEKEVENKFLFAVADGMGGYEKGEEASKIVLETLKEGLDASDKVEKILKKSKENVDLKAKEDAEFKNMGSTISGMYLDNESAIIFNVGDSRIYKYRSGFLEKLTRDHSIVQSLFERGIISEDEMRTHPRKNIVTTVISAGVSLDDIFIKEEHIKKGNIFLLCSDGMWESMPIEDIEEAIDEDDMKKSVDNLYKLSLENKSKDNISIIMIKIK